ncbi:MAG: hypothetical protein H6Q14_771 [Bacteroidetes bacterium]|nr:hypothetical protein [Bacteroidota bacterium]
MAADKETKDLPCWYGEGAGLYTGKLYASTLPAIAKRFDKPSTQIVCYHLITQWVVSGSLYRDQKDPSSGVIVKCRGEGEPLMVSASQLARDLGQTPKTVREALKSIAEDGLFFNPEPKKWILNTKAHRRMIESKANTKTAQKTKRYPTECDAEPSCPEGASYGLMEWKGGVSE